MAARRAGYGQIFFLAQNRAAPLDAATIPNWNSLAAALVHSQTAPLVIAPVTILSETDWLESLAKMRIGSAAWVAIPHRIIMLAATAVPDALTVLHTEGGACDITAVQDRLTRRFGSPAAVPIEIDPMVVVTSKDLRVAERRLLRRLVKDTDGFMARHVERPISLQVSRRLARTAITPNQTTMISVAIGLCGAPFFLSGLWFWQTVGALLFLVHSIVDGCDGELARLRFQRITIWWHSRFLGRQCCPRSHFRVHGCRLESVFRRDVAIVARRCGEPWHAGIGRLCTLATDARPSWQRSAFYLSFRGSRSASGPAARCRVTPRFHLSRAYSCSARQVELVSALGLTGCTDIFFPSGISCSARAAPRYNDNIRCLIAD